MGVMPGMYHQSELHLTDINVEPRMDENGEMRILGIEATLQVRLIVYEEEKIQILEDLYMLDHICIPEVKEKRFFRLKLQNHSKCRISEELTLPELKEDILQICHCKGKIQMETVKQRRMVYISTVCCTCSFYMCGKMIRRRLAYGMEWFRSVISWKTGVANRIWKIWIVRSSSFR